MITGTIVSIEKLGGYQSKGGWVYTFTMTIQGGNGPISGEIGSKSEVYPMDAGETISVEPTNTQHGMKFKKVNADYQQQPPQQNGQQAAPQPVRAANSSKGQPVDATRLSIERQCAIKSACAFLAGKTETTTQEVADAALLFANFMATGRPFFKGNEDGLMDKPESQDKTQPGVTEYVPVDDTPTAVSDEDIPF